INCVFWQAPPRAAARTYAVEAERAAAVVEVLPPEGPQGESVRVVDDGLRGVRHTVAAVPPAVAQLAVLRGGEGRVEAADGAEQVGGQGQIIRGEEPGPAGVGVIITVHQVNDDLAGG